MKSGVRIFHITILSFDILLHVCSKYCLLSSCYLLQFITDGERPEGSPRNLRVAAPSSTQLRVSWDEPDPALCHGAILRYNLGYKEFG